MTTSAYPRTSRNKFTTSGTTGVKLSSLPRLPRFPRQATHPSLVLSDVTNAARRIISGTSGDKISLSGKKQAPSEESTTPLALTKPGLLGKPSRRLHSVKPRQSSELERTMATPPYPLLHSTRRPSFSSRKGTKHIPSLFNRVMTTPTANRKGSSLTYLSRPPTAIATSPTSSYLSMSSEAHSTPPPSYHSSPVSIKKHSAHSIALLHSFSASYSDELLGAQPPAYTHGTSDGRVYAVHCEEEDLEGSTMLQVSIGGTEMIFHTRSPLDPTIVKRELVSKGIVNLAIPPPEPHIVVTRDAPSRITVITAPVLPCSALVEEWPPRPSSSEQVSRLPVHLAVDTEDTTRERGQPELVVPLVPAAHRPSRRVIGDRNKPHGRDSILTKSIDISVDAVTQYGACLHSVFPKDNPPRRSLSSIEHSDPSISSTERFKLASPRTRYGRPAALRSSQEAKTRPTSIPISINGLPASLVSKGSSVLRSRRLSGGQNVTVIHSVKSKADKQVHRLELSKPKFMSIVKSKRD
ncbi:hypothetical protein OF83DRAFT_191676 [Amylostereum chailletii]|nr:hypothetical protein OF83DRAFT_191676 [Amylostereum chailletii]